MSHVIPFGQSGLETLYRALTGGAGLSGAVVDANGSETIPAALTTLNEPPPASVGFDCPAIAKFPVLPSALLRSTVPPKVLRASESVEFTWSNFVGVFVAKALKVTARLPEPVIVSARFGFST